jgi:hypothetical protein
MITLMNYFMRNHFLLLIVCAYFFLSGCVKNNPDPSWIEINQFTIESNPQLTGGEGKLTDHGLTNAWVYVNEKLIGVFELPCKVPILMTGTAHVRLYPAILKNGSSATKHIYPFTDSYETTIELVQNGSVTINPITRYKTGTTFWVEDFEGSSVKLADGTNTQTSMLVDSDGPNRYGRVLLNSGASFWSAYTKKSEDDEGFTFPLGSEIYVEFDCKNTSLIETQFIYGKSDGSVLEQIQVGVPPSGGNWKKLYVELTEVVRGSGGFIFWFGFSSRLGEGNSEDLVLIDNIKIIYR